MNKSLEREDLIKESLSFTCNTLQEFDNIEPKGLDIIFEYKVGDKEYQVQESKKVVTQYRDRNNDGGNKAISKIEMEKSSKLRKGIKRVRVL